MGKGSNNIVIENEDSHESNINFGAKLLFFTREQVSKHNNKDDCWIIVNNYVYDLTKFQKIHPGGNRILNMYAGQDATEVFNAFHKEFEKVNKYSKIYLIGKTHIIGESNKPIIDSNSEKELRDDFKQLRLLAFEKVLKLVFTLKYYFLKIFF